MDEYSTSYKILTFLFKFFTKDAQISVSVGRPLNLVGNYVNADGNSYDQHGNLINTREYFMTQGKVTENPQREQEYTRILSKVITKEFHIINKVMASHMVAFVGFLLFRKEFPKLDLYSFFRLPEEDLSLEYDDFLEAFSIIKKEVLRLNKEGKVGIDDHMNESDEEIIQRGLKNVGMYHVVRPITRNKDGKIITQDLTTLYYYHNRMDGYDLEKLIS
jgi:glycerol-3-phosphate O-acyltransferase